MEKMMKVRILTGLGVLGLVAMSAAPAHASAISLNVDATAGPWDFVNGGLNTNFQYGAGSAGDNGFFAKDFTAPAAVQLSSLGLSAGQSVYVLFLGGLTSSFGGVSPTVDNAGYTYLTGAKDDAPGSTDGGFPSQYLPDEWGATQQTNNANVDGLNSGVFLNALVGAFTDAAGQIILDGGGKPYIFSVGTVTTTIAPPGSGVTGGFNRLIPAGATQIQFGINDDIFTLLNANGDIDNTGSLQVCVASFDPVNTRGCVNPTADPAVPEPASMLLLGSGLAAAALRRRRAAKK